MIPCYILKNETYRILVLAFSKRFFRKNKPPFQAITTDTGILCNPEDILPHLYHYYQNHILHPRFDFTHSHFSQVINEYESFLNTLHASNFVPLTTTTFEEVCEALFTLQPKLSLDFV